MKDNEFKEEVAEYKVQHGGFREGAGRPSLGVTKKVSITLPEEIWSKIERDIELSDVKTQSAYLRNLILKYFKESSKGGMMI